MRVIVAGTPDIAIPTLTALAGSEHEVVAVVTQPDARGKRGSALHPSPMKVAAESLGIEVVTPASAADPAFIEQVRSWQVDAAAVVAYGQILRPDLLAAVALGWVNLHFSLLPAWRGAAPVQRSIMAGDEITGACTFLIEKGLDTGPVIGVLTERIRATDTAGELLNRLAVAGAPLMVDSLTALDNGSARPAPQSADGVSYAHKLTRGDAYVEWDRPAHVVDRQIRGCTPAPGAWTTLPDGSPAKLGPVRPVADAPTTTPGLVRADGDRVLVGTGTDPVRLGWIAPAGKREMDAVEWWRGARWGDSAQLGEA